LPVTRMVSHRRRLLADVPLGNGHAHGLRTFTDGTAPEG
jgi:hypothetical protein